MHFLLSLVFLCFITTLSIAQNHLQFPQSMTQFKYHSQEQLITQLQVNSSNQVNTGELESPQLKLNMGKALLLSAMLPGAGQIYSGDTWQGIVFMGIEAAAWAMAISYNIKGKDKDKEFKRFADLYWSEETYRNKEFELATNPDPTINRQSAVPYSGTRENWNNLPWSANAGEYKSKYLPNNFTHELPNVRNQQFYEMIGKYLTQFGFGWLDQSNDNASTIGVWDGQSNYARRYADMRYDSNRMLELSNNMFMVVMLNHALSAAHAAISVQLKNQRTIEASLGIEARDVQNTIVPMPTIKWKF
ncbi:MAG: DUF5683 domain-containing protein [bacterium]|nr:DUF5683 domain-containing protein [bacterium]